MFKKNQLPSHENIESGPKSSLISLPKIDTIVASLTIDTVILLEGVFFSPKEFVAGNIEGTQK